MLTIDTSKVTQELVHFIHDAFKKSGFSKAVIALSGGVDSATSCALTVRAFGKDNVYPILLPYGSFNPTGHSDAKRVIATLDIPTSNVIEIDIKPMVDPLVSLDPSMDNIRKGNIMARMRMICLFDQAKKRTALVVGTENKSERLLGYFTRFGDSASDLEPLANLYKTQVFQLADYLGIPKEVISKAPTAGLWEGQTDEGEFEFTYKEADEILHMFYDQKKSVEDIVASGIDREVVEKVKFRIDANSFKHHLPLLPKTSKI